MVNLNFGRFFVIVRYSEVYEASYDCPSLSLVLEEARAEYVYGAHSVVYGEFEDVKGEIVSWAEIYKPTEEEIIERMENVFLYQGIE